MPVPRSYEAPGPAALAALPVLGALLGAAAGLAGRGAAAVLPKPCGAIVALGTLAVATGAIHYDGFLDGCDAFFASVSRERRLEILKDPCHGTFAIVGFGIVGGLSLAALAALPPRRYPAVLALAGATARLAAVAGAFAFPGARGQAGASHFAPSPAIVAGLGATAAASGVASLAFGRIGAALVPGAFALGLGCEAWICGRIGGLTGDAYGFTIVVVETAAIVTLAGAAARA